MRNEKFRKFRENANSIYSQNHVCLASRNPRRELYSKYKSNWQENRSIGDERHIVLLWNAFGKICNLCFCLQQKCISHLQLHFSRDDLRSTSIDNPFQKVPITLNTERKLVWKRPNFCTYVMTYFKAAQECEVGQKSLHMRNFDNYLSYSSYFQLKFPRHVFLNKGKVGPSSTTTKPSTSLSTKDNYGHLNLI